MPWTLTTRSLSRSSNVTIKRSKIHGSGSGIGVNVLSGSVTVQERAIYGFQNGITFSKPDRHQGQPPWHDRGWSQARRQRHLPGQLGPRIDTGPSSTLRWWTDAEEVTNLVVWHNNIDVTCCRCNAAYSSPPDLGPSSNGPVTITRNWSNGGNYTLFCVGRNNGQFHVKNISITSNTFSPSSGSGSAISTSDHPERDCRLNCVSGPTVPIPLQGPRNLSP